MDYSNGDLTLQRYYEPIKLSFVTNPHDPALGDSIWGNLGELDTLTHTAAPGAISHIDAFKKFLATANTNNNIGNAFAYGDRHTPGDNALSRRLSEIDRTIQHNAAKHGRLFPHLQTIADLWNEFKTGIPEKTVLIAQNYRDVVAKLEEQGCLATTETAKAGWDERLARTRANFTAYQSQLHAVPATSELTQSWQTSARPAAQSRFSLGEAFGNLRSAVSGLLPETPAQTRENSR
jgi:hypothetical protein